MTDLKVPTGCDMTPGASYKLEAFLELPDGETSRHSATELRINSACDAHFDAGPVSWSAGAAQSVAVPGGDNAGNSSDWDQACGLERN